MRRVTLYIAMSLDGCIADRNGGVDWLYGNSPGEGGGTYESFAAGVDTVIMGRRTYEQVTTELSVGAWPYVGMDCYVLTHRSCEPAPGVVFTAEAPEALIARLKALPGKDIWICGGAATAMQFVRAGLVDEYRISVIPAMLGAGTRLFDGLDGTRRLVLTGVSESGGIAELTYVSRDQSM